MHGHLLLPSKQASKNQGKYGHYFSLAFYNFQINLKLKKTIFFNSASFLWTNLLVIAAETTSPESDALDLIPSITSALLEEQHLIAGIVVLLDPGTIPINSRGEKQRAHLRELFMRDQLDPIYVAYNL